ncbi:MAG: ATP-binding protein [Elainella sp. Prado103]|jgi:signal transduction histidine kinase|nr:ATP-binding protein [Elainella sp. Prado103]
MSFRRPSLVLGLTLIGAIGALYAVTSNLLISNVRQIEAQKTQADVERVIETLMSQQRTVFNGLVDYAAWDATYDFVLGQKPDYTTVDLTNATFNSMNIDLVAISDRKSQLIYSVGYDPKTQTRLPLPHALQAYLVRQNVIQKHYPPIDPSLQALNNQELQVLMLPEAPAIVVTHPILTSEGEGPEVGYLLFGQYLDAGLIEQLSQLMSLKVSLYPYAEAARSLEFQPILDELAHQPIVVQPLDRDRIAGYTLIRDLEAHPIVILRSVSNRTVYQQGLLNLRYLGASLAVVGLFTGAIIWKLFQQSVQRLRDYDRVQQSLQQESALRQADQKYRQKAEELEKALWELQQAQTQLIHSEKMSSLGHLVAGIAHEINNPVNFISGNIDYAKTYTQELLQLVTLYQTAEVQLSPAAQAQVAEIDVSFLQEDLPKLIRSMRVGAERIQTIVRSLRNFSRLDETEIKSVDIHEGIESTLLLLQSRLKLRGSKPEIAVLRQYGDLPWIECYPSQLNQVFMNLLSNAIDALEEKMQQDEIQTPGARSTYEPTIWIQTEKLGSTEAVIRIGDNGAPISETVQKHMFDPFFTTKTVGKGTGLGLAISYQIVVEKHQGSLSCHNVGNGVEFIVQIPLHRIPRTVA